MGLYVVNDDVVHVIVCAAQRMGLILLFEVIYFYKYCLFLFVSNKVIFFMFEDSWKNNTVGQNKSWIKKSNLIK